MTITNTNADVNSNHDKVEDCTLGESLKQTNDDNDGINSHDNDDNDDNNDNNDNGDEITSLTIIK